MAAVSCGAPPAAEPSGDPAPQPSSDDSRKTIRFATFNVSLFRDTGGQLARDLAAGSAKARQVAEILQRVRPDVVLLNEFDYDPSGEAARLFQENYLAVTQNGQEPLDFPHRYTGPVNTGVPTGLDLNRDGKSDGPEDGFGFGRHPGQYGMVVFSRYPIDDMALRTFQKFRWRDMPGALLPTELETGEPYYPEEALEIFRLSSKSHWDLPLDVEGERVHLLVCHPTPPVFDGPEDRNGRRNHDEIRLWADYVEPARADYLIDDAGRRGGLPADVSFVIAGDLNADPQDGDSAGRAIDQLLFHPRVSAESVPASEGAKAAARTQGGANDHQRGDPAHDTADFNDRAGGNLRIDYVLPSRNLEIVAAGVFWPPKGEEGAELVDCSDHRLVWVDVRP